MVVPERQGTEGAGGKERVRNREGEREGGRRAIVESDKRELEKEQVSEGNREKERGGGMG